MASLLPARYLFFVLLTALLWPGTKALAFDFWPTAKPAQTAEATPADEKATDKVTDRAPDPSAAGQAPRLVITPNQPTIPTIDLTAETDDLWQRMRNGFAMPNLSNELVTSQQAWILARPDYLRHTLERGRRYMHFIVGELEKRGMPTELALLPMVESSYNPMAISPARASGLWQFIPSTGKSYGLKQDWWADDRRDIVASTSAALDYLQMLYEMQGDWQLALASYNWGEGSVQRAMAKNRAAGKPVDYMSLTMPAETRNYVPKLQALKNIIAQPQLFGVNLTPIPNRPYFKTVKNPADMDMATAARLAETPLAEFRALNPSHNRPVLRSQGAASLVLPADKVDTFLTNYQESDKGEKPLVSWGNYTLRKKDRLDQVAARFGITLERLKQINSLGPKTKLAAGQTLLVPASVGTEPGQDIGKGLTPPPEALAPMPPRAKAGKHGGKRVSANYRGKAAKAAKTKGKAAGKSARKAAGNTAKKSGGKVAKPSSGKKPAVAAKKKRH